jgi:hypothetical protein
MSSPWFTGERGGRGAFAPNEKNLLDAKIPMIEQ